MKILIVIITIVTALMGLAAVAPRSEKKEKNATPESINATLIALADQVFGNLPEYHDETGVGRSRIAANCLDEWRTTNAEANDLDHKRDLAYEVFNTSPARLDKICDALIKAKKAESEAFEKLWLALYLDPEGSQTSMAARLRSIDLGQPEQRRVVDEDDTLYYPSMLVAAD